VSRGPADEGGSSGTSVQPSVDAVGGVIAFASDRWLVPEAQAVSPQVYVRSRFPEPTTAPEAIEFGEHQVGVPGPTALVRVANAGPGPAYVDLAVTGPFALSDGCAVGVLHRDESCTVEVSFVPTGPGAHEGTVSVALDAFAWPPRVDEVDLTGTAVDALLAVTPESVEFPDTGLGIASRPVTVRATNLSASTIDVAVAAIDGARHFRTRPRDGAGCPSVPASRSCELRLAFRPLDLGDLAGTFEVVAARDGVEVSVLVPATGTTLEPELSFSPSVAQQGRVTFLSGEHFMPGRPLDLEWSRGPMGSPEVVPEPDGSFAAPIVVLAGAGTGERTVVATTAGVTGEVESPPLLVVPGSAQPPDFVSRH
jgi:hypothetical protein